jgi:hypothetical protein
MCALCASVGFSARQERGPTFFFLGAGLAPYSRPTLKQARTAGNSGTPGTAAGQAPGRQRRRPAIPAAQRGAIHQRGIVNALAEPPLDRMGGGKRAARMMRRAGKPAGGMCDAQGMPRAHRGQREVGVGAPHEVLGLHCGPAVDDNRKLAVLVGRAVGHRVQLQRTKQ